MAASAKLLRCAGDLSDFVSFYFPGFGFEMRVRTWPRQIFHPTHRHLKIIGDNRVCHFLLLAIVCRHGKIDLLMNVSLTPELEKFVAKEVDSGLYQTASEVVRAGLRRLKEEREARAVRRPATLDELESQLVQAVGALDAGRGVNGEMVFRRLRKRIKEARG
jgi:antitoxin ParD1/3/4